MALFGMTAKEWREHNPGTDGNLRDQASLEQLVVLTNLESLNAVLIAQGIAQGERLEQLNHIAISQLTTLLRHKEASQLLKG